MEYVDVVFCFDEKMAKYFCVAVKSLLVSHSSQEYQYCIHCITVSEGQEKVNEYLSYLGQRYNFWVKFYIVEKSFFSGSFEIRNITVATYFRFLIPELLSGIEKVIYIDIDVIINGELWELYKIDMKDLFFKGVKGTLNLSALWANESKRAYWGELEKCHGKYLNAGVLLMNLRLIREYQIINKWKLLMKKEFYYQDQDIINMTCSEKIGFIPLKYNCIAYWNEKLLSQMEREKIFTMKEIEEAIENPVIIHFAGKKPWQTFSNGSLFAASEWWKYVIDDDILLEWFREDLLTCINNVQGERKDIIWKADRNNANYLFMNEWFHMKQKGFNLAYTLKKQKYNIIAIYGTSHIGQRLYEELQNTDIIVKYGIDSKKRGEWCGLEVFSPEEELPNVDVIIVTAIFSYDEILKKLHEKVNSPIISIAELVRVEEA